MKHLGFMRSIRGLGLGGIARRSIHFISHGTLANTVSHTRFIELAGEINTRMARK
jgi:hypothetical protein